MSPDYSDQITNYATDFLSQLLSSSDSQIQVNFESNTATYQLLITTNHPALIIGYHGETLSAVQQILSIHINHLLPEHISLSVNVNDYRERRQSSIESLAQATVAKVLATGRPHTLPPMSPAERRLVHVYLSEHAHVTTTSQGEGRDRSVVISLKSPASN